MRKEVCATKKQYGSYHHARFDAREVTRKYEEPHVVYQCRFCGKFHVGEPQNRLQGRKKRN